MPTSLQLFPTTVMGNDSGTSQIAADNVVISGIGSWVAFPFIAHDNWNVNRLSYHYAAVSNSTAATQVTVGIGTLNSETGLPLLDGSNNLSFIGSTTVSSLTAEANTFREVGLLNNLSLVQANRYYLGIQTIARSASNTAIQIRTTVQGGGYIRGGNYIISNRTTTGVPTLLNFGAEHAPINYGFFDSGTSTSSFYNKYFYGTSLATQVAGTAGSEFGFTFYMNSDLNAIEISEVGIITISRLGTIGGLGNTWTMTLYDSDGTTALTASTSCYYASSTTNYRATKFPINYTLQNNKLYYFAASGIGSNNSLIAYYNFPIQFTEEINGAAGTAISSYYFSKDNPTTAPVVFKDRKMYNWMNVIETFGSRQGGSGRF